MVNMLLLRLSEYFVYTLFLLMTIVRFTVTSQCIYITKLDTYLHGNRLDCYGNCKYTITGVFGVIMCLKECLRFSFCTAVNYNRAALVCELVYIQGTLRSDMVVANDTWAAVYATGIPQVIGGVCANHDCLVSQKCVELTSGERTCVNHGIVLAPGLYGNLIPNTRLYHPQGTTGVTMYECAALTDEIPTTSYPVSRLVDGVYTPAHVSCSALDCLRPGVPYTGRVTVTEEGTLCQRWDANIPHNPAFLGDRSDLHNWCRLPDPDEGSRPWCYTTDPNKRWSYCPIINCP